MAMQGNLQVMAVADLIQHSCQESRTAKLTVDQNGRQAVLYFNEGSVQHATLGNKQGEEAVYDLLTWHEGDFSLEMEVSPPEITISRSWASLLLEGARRLDENNQAFNQDLERTPKKMANIKETLDAIMEMDGAIAAAIVDWQSGMTLGTIGTGMNIDVAAAGNTNVVRAKFGVMKDLKIKGGIEDILITLTDQYHIIRMMATAENLFIYVALNRSHANLGLARHKLAQIEKDLSV